MDPATDKSYSVKQVLDALVAQLRAVQWEEGEAFQRVEVFDIADIEKPLGELIMGEERIAIVIPEDVRFDSSLVQAGKALVTRVLPVALLISDRVLGNRQTAMFGDDLTPGAWGLVQAAIPAVTGLLLPAVTGLQAVRSVPVSAGARFILDEKRGQAGRAMVEVDLEISGGTIEAVLGRAPIL